MAKTSKSYNEKSIKHLADCEGIRRRPGMYIGSIGPSGVKRLFMEAVGNVIDEFQAGRASNLFININEKTSQIQVLDDGAGIPVGKLDEVMTKIHAGGKFDNEYGGFSIGMNGIGNKAINALSEETIVIIKRDGFTWKQIFSKGKAKTELQKIGKTKETGTSISFIPDKEIMKDISIDSMDYFDFVERLSFLNKGLKITFHATKKQGGEINKIIQAKKGLKDYLLTLDKNLLLSKPIVIREKGAKDNIKMEIELVFNYSSKYDDEVIKSFVNGLETIDGGTHNQGFKMALTEVIRKYIITNNLLTKKDGKLDITGDDVREGLVAILSTKHSDPLFSSQTKDKMTSDDIMGFTKKVVTDQLTQWLNTHRNEAKVLSNKVILSAKGRMAAKRAKLATSKKTSGLTMLSSLSKFTGANSNLSEERELFITEGSSAGGTASQARDPETQSIYRLRGKPLNTHDLDAHKIMLNKEFNDIITILGCGMGKTFNIEGLTHEKIIFLTDADLDGFHISSLLSTFFFKHTPDLIRNGNVYIAQPPLYRIKEDGKDIYIKNKEEYNSFIDKKIINSFNLCKKVKGERVEIEGENFKEFLRLTRGYLSSLNNIASKFAINEKLAETLIANYRKDMVRLEEIVLKKFKEIKVDNNGDILYINGMIDNIYQSLNVNSDFFESCEELTNIYKKLKISSNLYLKKTEEKVYRKTPLAKILQTIYDEVTPKSRQHYKGLGEMEASQLWETALDPKRRKLIRLNLNDFDKATEKFEVLMGKDADKRKVFMANFVIDPEDLDG